MEHSFIVKGNFYYSNDLRGVVIQRDSYCVVENGISRGIFREIPEKYEGLAILDYSGYIIMPGLIDLHTHAPQYSFRGIGLDLELIEWLNKYTFPEESEYRSVEYADAAYDIFADDLRKSYTTRAVMFGTIYADTTLLLMEKMERSGLYAYVGKVNMDRNSPDYYIEDKETSLNETRRFVEEAVSRFERTKPILTPRFVPTCSDELLEGLGEIRRKTNLPVQSHLSENRNEIKWVRELCPDAEFYGDAYDRFGLFGNGCRTIMAHCVSSKDEELERMRKNQVMVAHCPGSNMNLSSGIAPVRKMLDCGISVGLGTDIGASYNLSIAEEMIRVVQASNMRWRYVEDEKPISIEESFYLATRGGGAFFGKVGSFEEGYEFDALVIDDSKIRSTVTPGEKDRFLRSLYLSGECELKAKFAGGRQIDLK